MMLVTLPDLYTNEYGWGTGISGLVSLHLLDSCVMQPLKFVHIPKAYIGPGIGSIVGTAFFVKVGEIVSAKVCFNDARSRSGFDAQLSSII